MMVFLKCLSMLEFSIYHDPADLLLDHKASLNTWRLIPVERNPLLLWWNAKLSLCNPTLFPSTHRHWLCTSSPNPAACLWPAVFWRRSLVTESHCSSLSLGLTSVLTKVPLVADEKCQRLHPQWLSLFLRDDGWTYLLLPRGWRVVPCWPPQRGRVFSFFLSSFILFLFYFTSSVSTHYSLSFIFNAVALLLLVCLHLFLLLPFFVLICCSIFSLFSLLFSPSHPFPLCLLFLLLFSLDCLLLESFFSILFFSLFFFLSSS